ncbi:MAG: ubiquitin-like protein Pup [bacterium]|jgi:ubiquitin-like protein Pup
MQVPQSRRSDSWVGVGAWTTGGQDQRQRSRETQETEQTESAKSVSSDKGQKLKEDLDHLIDQIDEVLEENAEEFVRNYVQRGGQ